MRGFYCTRGRKLKWFASPNKKASRNERLFVPFEVVLSNRFVEDLKRLAEAYETVTSGKPHD